MQLSCIKTYYKKINFINLKYRKDDNQGNFLSLSLKKKNLIYCEKHEH